MRLTADVQVLLMGVVRLIRRRLREASEAGYSCRDVTTVNSSMPSGPSSRP